MGDVVSAAEVYAEVLHLTHEQWASERTLMCMCRIIDAIQITNKTNDTNANRDRE